MCWLLSCIVLIVCIILGLMVCLNPNSGAYFPSVTPEKSDSKAYFILLWLITFEAASSLCFIIFSIRSRYYPFCNWIRMLWLLVHFALGITTLVIIFNIMPARYSVEFLKEKASQGTSTWLRKLQHSLDCCWIENKKEKDKDCEEAFHEGTIEQICASTLQKYTAKCQRVFMTYTAIMLCIGVIPFVICSLTQRKAKKEAKAKRKAKTLPVPPRPPLLDTVPKNKKPEKCNCYDRQPPAPGPDNDNNDNIKDNSAIVKADENKV